MKGRNFASVIYGRKVINGTRRITLDISPKEAKEASAKNPGDCAAARAAVRGVPNCRKARIFRGRAYLLDEKKNVWMRYKTSPGLRTELIAFDKGGKFEPGKYELIPLYPSDLLVWRQEQRLQRSAGDTSSSKTHKMPRKLHVVQGVRHRPTKADFQVA